VDDLGGLMFTVDTGDSADDRRDAAATTDLSRELSRTVQTQRVTAEGEEGSKSAGALLNSLMISGVLSAASIKAVASIAIAFIRRGAARKITLKDGDREFTITDPSRETEHALTAWLTAKGDDRAGDR
jgi:hypothetical protein